MLERERINRYLTPSLALPDAREVFVRQESGWTWRLLFPNGIDPFSILNDLIGGDQRATEVSGGCNYRSVSGIANSGQGNGFKKDFDCVGLDLKVCGTIQLSRPAPKRHGQPNYLFLDQTGRFFQDCNGHDDRVFPLLDLLKNSLRPFSQSSLPVGCPKHQRMGIGDVDHLRPETSFSKDSSRSLRSSASARSTSPTSFMLPRSLSGDCFATLR